MLNKKSIRITVGFICLFVLIISIVPNFYLYSSSDGVVNAHTTTLKSPIEGIVNFQEKVKHGKFFKKSEIIGTVTNDRVNRAHLHELMTEKKTLEGRIKNLSERIAEYTKLKDELTVNQAKYQKFAGKQLSAQIKQTENRLVQERAEFERSKKEFDANKTLDDKLAVKRRELERTESNYLKAEAKVLELENQLEEFKNSLSAIEAGVFLGSGNNDSPYSKQRMDQLVIEISLAKTALEEAKCRIDGIIAQIETEQGRIQKVECFTMVTPFDALAWRIPVNEGSTVIIGSETIVLLECSSVFLDIAVSESQFANIKSGDKIQYRLIGESGFHKGVVFALRGSGSDLSDKNLAAGLSKDPKKEFHIWVEVNPKDLDLRPENFFQVGRRLEVKIPRKWQPLREIARFFNVF